MQTQTWMTCALLLLAHQAHSATLNELINQNVQDATQAYEQTLPSAQRNVSTAQLWVHIRNENQRPLAQAILARVKNTALARRKIEAKTIEKVAYGPDQNQLRYFKREDRAQAQMLLEQLRPLVPRLELSDLSGQYNNASWLESGHYEVWLAP